MYIIIVIIAGCSMVDGNIKLNNNWKNNCQQQSFYVPTSTKLIMLGPILTMNGGSDQVYWDIYIYYF